MKKSDLFPLFHALTAVSTYPGAKFGYAVAKNLAKVKEECIIIEKLQEPSEEFKAYDNARIELCKEHANKDEAGEPILKGNEYDLKNKMIPFLATLQVLNKTHKEALDAREKQMTDVQILLEEESDIMLCKIKEDNFPEAITAQQITGIMAMIEEEK